MPRIASNYDNTIIYAILCNNPEITECYVGSTSCMYSRLRNHHSDCKNPQKNQKKIYQFITEHGGFENWSIKQLEVSSFNSQRESEERELYWCKTLNATLNTRSPIVDLEKKKKRQQNYYQEKKDVLQQKHKEYYLQNREKILGRYHLKKLLNIADNNSNNTIDD